jgi:hypothetical protein
MPDTALCAKASRRKEQKRTNRRIKEEGMQAIGHEATNIRSISTCDRAHKLMRNITQVQINSKALLSAMVHCWMANLAS